ncbi:restriction endonuclease subunit S [Rothia dentocariosa]|uniref:restriction endonuclease subunit S n=1 Tax=Rothia dentocariosa TaxID=2047 RepID=UPI0028E870B3|nr:restriction endonuclease subunit S [Rothia dentocariosa]
MATLTDTQRAAGWKKYVLSDIVEIIGGGTPKTSIPEYWNGDIPWLSVTDFSGDSRYVYDTEKKITQDGLENSSTKLLLKDDIIISARGTVGELAQLSSPMAFNQSCFGIRAIPDKLNQSYLYYLLRTVIEELRQNSHGSIFSTITRKTFDTIEVIVPPHKEQERIAAILDSLDDKIEASIRFIQVLNNSMEFLYKKYSANGQDKILTDLAEFVNGRAFTKNATGTGRMVIRIAELNSGPGASTVYNDINGVRDENLARSGDILMSWSGSLDVYVWTRSEAIINQHIFKVIAKSGVSQWMAFYACKSAIDRFKSIAADKATTMGHIRRSDLNTVVRVPTTYIPGMNELWELRVLLEETILNLSETRDLLIKSLIG